MNSISQLSPDLLSKNALGPNQRELMNTQASSTQYQVQKSTDFTLYTAEGDKVTLSTFSNMEASVATYNQMGIVDGAEMQRQDATFSVSQEFSMSFAVEGDLNPQELKDLIKAFKTIEKLTSDFFKGDTEKAADRANKIASLSSIARFEGVLQYQKSLSVEQTVTQSAPATTAPVAQNALLPAEVPSINPLPADEPAQVKPASIPAPGPSQTETETKTPLAPVSLDSASIDSRRRLEITALVAKITETLEESSVPPRKITKHLNKFMDRLFGKQTRRHHHKEDMNLQDLKMTEEIKTQLTLNLSKSAKGEGMTQGQDLETAHQTTEH